MGQDRQPPPRASNRFAPLISEQTFQEQTGIRRNTLLVKTDVSAS